MNRILVIAAVVTCTCTTVAAQTVDQKDLVSTCRTLAALTAEATKVSAVQDILLYKHTSDKIRQLLNDPRGCEVEYFNTVVSKSRAALEMTGLYLSMGFTRPVRPVKGWSHHEIDEFFSLAESKAPDTVLRQLKIEKNKELQISVDELMKDMQQLKRSRPDLFKQ